jgi:signal transduction histidine kinase
MARADLSQPGDSLESVPSEVKDLLAENRALKEELRKALTEQEALLQFEKRSALNRLASEVAHELRSPLAVILARTQLLLMSARDGSRWKREQVEKSLKTVEEQALRVARIVEGLSAYVRPRPPEFVQVGPEEVISEARGLKERNL